MRGFVYRIYPNKKQEVGLNIMFQAKRFVWNHFLEINMGRFEEKLGILSYNKMSSLLTELKQLHKWLYKCEKSVLQNTLKDLSEAYTHFFEGSMKYSEKTIEHAKKTGKEFTFYNLEGHPKFKSYKNPYQSVQMSLTNNNIEVIEKEATYTPSGKYKKQNCKIKLPKIKNVKIAYSRQYEGRILSAAVSRESDGKFYISLCCADIPEKAVELTHVKVGIDLGIKVFATISDGKAIPNPKYYEVNQKKLVKLQKQLSHCKKGSNNRNKARLKLNKCHKKIYNSRLDFLHKTTTDLIRAYDIICIENLKPKEMQKEKYLAKSISDASFSEFKTLLTYKMEHPKKQLVVIDQYYPSSQKYRPNCCNCDYQNKMLKDLKIRTWTCPSCGVEHDRDINASKNILREGLKQIS